MAEHIERREVACANQTIIYQLTRKNVKNVNLRIKPDGTILVSANNRISTQFIDTFIREKQDFIFKALEKNTERQSSPARMPKKYITGEVFRILGEDYTLQVQSGWKEYAVMDGCQIILTVKDTEDISRKEKVFHTWLQKYMRQIFGQICRDTYAMFSENQVPWPTFKIRTMTSRWGSCHTVKNIITLNSRLIEVPKEAVEYVVLHEFAHFLQPNHSRAFYAVVERYMPDWRERKALLNM